jgi:hypothetical protein
MKPLLSFKDPIELQVALACDARAVRVEAVAAAAAVLKTGGGGGDLAGVLKAAVERQHEVATDSFALAAVIATAAEASPKEAPATHAAVLKVAVQVPPSLCCVCVCVFLVSHLSPSLSLSVCVLSSLSLCVSLICVSRSLCSTRRWLPPPPRACWRR